MINDTAAMTANDTDNDYTTDDDTTLGGQFVTGLCFLAFGSFFLGLTAFRINRIAAALAFLERSSSTESSEPTPNGSGIVVNGTATTRAVENHQDDDNDNNNHQQSIITLEASGGDLSESSPSDPSDHVTLWARTYCRQHIPEYDTAVIRRTSVALLLCTTLGLLLESVGGVWAHFYLRHEDHDTSASFSLHETITLLFLVTGITAWWEAAGYLPRDSTRVVAVVAFGGQALLWHLHATSKADNNNNATTTARIHEAKSWLGAATAIAMLLSIMTTHCQSGARQHNRRNTYGLHDSMVEHRHHHAGDYPCALFFLHVSSLILITWQGCWSITAGTHSWTPLQSDRVPCYFVLQGLFLFVMAQTYLIILVRRYRPKRHYGRIRQTSILVQEEHSPANVQMELN